MNGTYVAAVIGGACAGSEIASQLSDLGMDVIVFEQNPLPYGKIEDGLPRWHVKLQAKEMSKIDEKLSRPTVHFVPNCKLGTDILLQQLVHEWRLPLVVMANGAWRDRPLHVAGVEAVVDDSFLYQNPFVYWFNHYHEKNYQGPRYRVQPGAVVIGGGLASIDVVKICQFELISRELAQRGHAVELIELEHYGIFKALETRGIAYDDLNLKPARLFYRKRVRDMPLVPLGEAPTADKLEKAKKVREKIINNAQTRYGFEVHPLRAPARIHTQNGSVSGVSFDVNAYRNGKFVKTGEVELVATNQVISSIGSIPEPVPGVPMDGELYLWENRFTGEVQGMPGVYCVGNAITGRGNIKDSLQNAKRLGALITAGMNRVDPDYESWFAEQREQARAHVDNMIRYLRQTPPLPPSGRETVLARVKQLQQERGYQADYATWRDRVLQAR